MAKKNQQLKQSITSVHKNFVVNKRVKDLSDNVIDKEFVVEVEFLSIDFLNRVANVHYALVDKTIYDEMDIEAGEYRSPDYKHYAVAIDFDSFDFKSIEQNIEDELTKTIL